MSAAPLDDLSFEEFSLFNPAFLALLVRESAKGHETYGQKRGLPVVLAYLIVPLALHRATREALPSRANAQMAEWTQGHPLVLVGLSQRVSAMRPLVSPAITFALHRGALIAADGTLSSGEIGRRRAGFAFTADSEGCLRTSGFLGRWLARQPDALTALAVWGLRP